MFKKKDCAHASVRNIKYNLKYTEFFFLFLFKTHGHTHKVNLNMCVYSTVRHIPTMAGKPDTPKE